MANKTKPKSRIATKKQLVGKPRIKPWMLSIFVFLIAVVGVLVIYRSFAAELPQSVIDEAMASLVINQDGTSTVSVASLNYKKTFSQADTIRAGLDPNYYNKLIEIVISELQVLYDKAHPNQPPPTTPPPSTPPPSTPSPVQPKPNQPSNPSTPGSQNPSGTPGQTPSQPIDPNSKPAAKPSENIKSTSKAKETLSSLEYDLQNPSAMPVYSGVAAFKLSPPDNLAGADTVGIYVDRELVKSIKPNAKEFSINTARLENGVHRLDVVVYDKSDNPLARYVFMFQSQNNLNFLDRALQPILSLIGL